MRVLLTLAACAAIAAAHSDEALRAADAVVAAGGDAAALERLARADDPDPWLVADILCRRGAFDAALGFARAAPRVDTRKLPDYVLWARGRKLSAANLDPLLAAAAGVKAKSGKRVVAALRKVDAEDDPIARIRVVEFYHRMLFGTGRVEQALEQLKKARAETEKLGWVAYTAHLHRLIGSRYYSISRFEQSRAAWQARLEVEETRGHQAGVAEALVDIAETLRHRARNKEGLALCLRALKIVDGLDNDRLRVKVAMHLGNAYIFDGQLDEGIRWYEETLRLRREVGPPWKVAKDLINLGNVQQMRGEHLRALRRYEEATRITADMFPGETRLAGFQAAGASHYKFGNYPRAEALYKEALAIARKIKMRYRVASSLWSLANIRSVYGEHARSIELHAQALTVSREIGAKSLEANLLASLGREHSSVGEHARALTLFEQALAVQEKSGDAFQLAQTLGSIGSLYASLGDLERAHALLVLRLRIAEGLKSKPGIAEAAAALSPIHVARGEPEKAIAALRRAIDVSKEVGSKPDTVTYLRRLGYHEARHGDVRKALAPMEQARRLATEIGDKPRLASVLVTLGDVRRGLGDHDGALEDHRAALGIVLETGAVDLEASCRQSIAATLLARGDAVEAAVEARRAMDAIQVTVRGLSEELGASARSGRAELFDTGVLAALETGSIGDACFFLESGRAGSLLESLGGRAALREAAVPEALRRAEEEARGAEAAARLIYREAAESGKRAEIREAQLELKAARTRVNDVVARIQRETKAAAEVAYPSAMEIARIQATLRSGDALVIYGLGEEKAVALVATEKAARLIALGKTEAIEAACDTKLEPERVARLRALVLEPLALDGVKRLLVCPDGALGYVPFVLLAGGREIAYVPSGTTYVHLSGALAQRGEDVLALGDPDYGTVPKDGVLTVMRSGATLAPLPATLEEAKRVGDVVLLGAEANETRLRETLDRGKRWRAVHFACHGLVDAEQPSLSSLALSPDRRNDGFLTCLEIFRMDIPADLVVLSACETARGRFYRAEGIVGLTRAFMQAGAPRVLCSLWKVDDAATSALMVKFYELWRTKRLSAAGALQGAQHHVAAHGRWKHPRYWAAWVLWGLPD